MQTHLAADLNVEVSASKSNRRRYGGFSLVELMVVLVVSMIVSIAVMGILSTSEGRKRTTTGRNDIEQAGNFVNYQLDKSLRSAGSGFSQSAYNAYADFFGCEIYASAAAPATSLPLTTALPAPFAGIGAGGAVLNALHVFPILVIPNQTQNGSDSPSDTLIAMSGSAGFAEIATPFSLKPPTDGSFLNLSSIVEFQNNELILIGDQASGSAQAPCLVQQVGTITAAPGTSNILPLSTAYAHSVGAVSVSGNYSDTTSIVADLGNTPSFMLYGVLASSDADPNNVPVHTVLYSYDILNISGQVPNNPVPISDGVFMIKALYGVGPGQKTTVTAWVDPSSDRTYNLAALTTGAPAAAALLRDIKAIHLAIVMRSSELEKQAVAPPYLTLYTGLVPAPSTLSPTSSTLACTPDPSLPNTYAVCLTDAQRHYRYRVIEMTIPLRNLML